MKSKWLILLVMFAFHCAAASFPDYPVRPVGDYSVSDAKSGLVVAIHPLEDAKEQKTYFHTELAPKGFLPVLIVMQNQSADSSFLIKKEGISHGGAAFSTPEARSKAGQTVAIASMAAISLAGGIVAMKLIANATNVQQNILKKELQSKTLSPGASAHGFLYVPVPKGSAREKIHLSIPVTLVGSDETLILNLVF